MCENTYNNIFNLQEKAMYMEVKHMKQEKNNIENEQGNVQKVNKKEKVNKTVKNSRKNVRTGGVRIST